MSDELVKAGSELYQALLGAAKRLQPLAMGLNAAIEDIRTSPQFQSFQAGLLALAQAMPKVEIVFAPQVSELLRRLPEWAKNLEANRILLDQAIASLEESKYRAVWHVFRFRDLLEFSNLSQEQIADKLYRYTTGAAFRSDVLALYYSSGLSLERGTLIEEALSLHEEGRFGGSVTLLYSQIEGVLGDALIALGLAEKDGPRKIRAHNSPNRELRGVQAKLELARDRVEGSEIYMDLLKECIVAGSIELSLAPSRNGVLHGTDTDFANAERSTQLALWLTALLIELRVLGNQAVPEHEIGNIND